MIQLENVSKVYKSFPGRQETVALSNLTLTAARGEVVGIAGPNGAGKSTLISLLLGFIRPTAGQALIDGQAPYAYRVHHGISYVSELVDLPPRFRVRDMLKRLCVLSGVESRDRDQRVAAVMQQFEIQQYAAVRLGKLSKGTLQRVSLAQAMLRDSDVIIFDEPTHGLDPSWIIRFREMVASLRRPDRVILLASHDLSELEQLVDRAVILDRGEIRRIVTLGGTRAEGAAMEWQLVFEGEPDVAAHLAQAIRVAGESSTWRATASRAAMTTALAALFHDGAVLVECSPRRGRVEDAFREVTTS